MLTDEVDISEQRGQWNGIDALPRPTSSTGASYAPSLRPTEVSETPSINDISEAPSANEIFEMEASNVYS
jgi:hypothetical protein